MKKLFALMLVVAMVLSLAACSTPKGSVDGETESKTEESTGEKVFRYAVAYLYEHTLISTGKRRDFVLVTRFEPVHTTA